MDAFKILIVDDNEIDRYSFSRYLSDYGNVKNVENGQDCIDLCKQHDYKPDCIILDHCLSDITGIEVLDKLQDLISDGFTQVVFVTGHGSEETAVSALKKGAHDYLIKSKVNQENLQEAILSAQKRIEELKEKYKKTEYLEKCAFHDYLTETSNLTSLNVELPKMMEWSDSFNKKLAILFIDLDKFKQVNDNYSHSIGNKVLKQFTNRIKEVTKSTDIISRIGGDEFAVVLFDVDNKEQVTNIASRIIQHTILPYDIDNNSINIGVSVGIEMYPRGSIYDHKTLLDNADKAMYEAKNNKKQSLCFYDEVAHKLNSQKIE